MAKNRTYERSGFRGFRAWVFVVVCVLACRRQAGDSARHETPPSPAGPSETQREPRRDLETLGYVDFSEEPSEGNEGVVVHDRERSYPGFNLYTLISLHRTELVDAHGQVVHFWTRGNSGRWARSLLLSNGDLLVVGNHFEREADNVADLYQGFVLRLNWNNEVVWERPIREAHHDIAPMPDGTYLIPGFEIRRIPSFHPESDVKDDRILRVRDDGEIIEFRSLYDMMAKRPDLYRFREVEKGRHAIDLFHANSVRWIDETGSRSTKGLFPPQSVIVCMRHQNAVAVFDWDRQELVWAWGQEELSGPHDASLLGNGHVLIFDNGLDRRRSRVLEVDPGSGEIVWKYDDPEGRFYSAARGANQRLPNGNTLITESNRGHAFEVTSDGEIVWEYFVPHRDARDRRAAINRCYRYEATMIEPLLHGDINSPDDLEEPGR